MAFATRLPKVGYHSEHFNERTWMCYHQAPPLVRVVAHVGDAGQAKPHLEHNPLSLLGACHATPIRKLNDPELVRPTTTLSSNPSCTPRWIHQQETLLAQDNGVAVPRVPLVMEHQGKLRACASSATPRGSTASCCMNSAQQAHQRSKPRAMSAPGSRAVLGRLQGRPTRRLARFST